MSRPRLLIADYSMRFPRFNYQFPLGIHNAYRLIERFEGKLSLLF